MRSIVVGDTHIGVKKSSKTYLNTALTLFDQVCDYAEKHSISNLYQVGDLCDNRKALTHEAIDTVIKIGEKCNHTFVRSYFIVGNHDTPYKDVMFPHSLLVFKKYKNIVIVDKPTYVDIDGVLMLPWLFDIDKDMTNARVCIGHFDINGAAMNSTGTMSRNHFLNFSDFAKYELTISGHYHTPNTYNHNVKYIGSPYQLTFNDMGSLRGFYVLDTTYEKPSLEFVPFHDYPHHYSYTDKSTDIEDVEGHIVRLTFTEDYGIDGNSEIIQKFRDMKPYSLRVKYANLDDTMTDGVIDETVVHKSKLEILNEFHEKSDLPEGVNLAILNKVSESIYKEMKGDEA